jgi:hypothetical protein
LKISKQSMPRATWQARRRRYGDERWLVRFNDFYELDPITDAVWLGCQDGLTVEGIVHRVAECEGLPAAEALAATVAALERFAELGLVELQPA